jgi:hypothetical protein
VACPVERRHEDPQPVIYVASAEAVLDASGASYFHARLAGSVTGLPGVAKRGRAIRPFAALGSERFARKSCSVDLRCDAVVRRAKPAAERSSSGEQRDGNEKQRQEKRAR